MSDELEHLGIFDLAIGLGRRIFALTARPPFRRQRILGGRLKSTTVSVVANIAKGLARETALEQRRFFHVALGTSGEVRIMLARLGKTRQGAALEPEISKLRSGFENINGQLHAVVASLGHTETRERGRPPGIDPRRKAVRDHQQSPQAVEEIITPAIAEVAAGDGDSPGPQPAERPLSPPPQGDALGQPARDPKPGAH